MPSKQPRGTGPDSIPIHGVTLDALAADYPLSFTPPLINHSPSPAAFEYNWQRDNLSYFVLDGAQSWIEKRLPDVEAKGMTAFAEQLKSLHTQIIALRDELEEMAQKFQKRMEK